MWEGGTNDSQNKGGEKSKIGKQFLMQLEETHGLLVSKKVCVYGYIKTFKFILMAFFFQIEQYEKDQLVQVENDATNVCRLQNGHGPWNDGMKKVEIITNLLKIYFQCNKTKLTVLKL